MPEGQMDYDDYLVMYGDEREKPTRTCECPDCFCLEEVQDGAICQYCSSYAHQG